MPDIVVFAKKMQVGGILCSRRIEEVPDHVFSLSSRINSTWGGGLVDMVRATEILEIIHDEGLLENAAAMGELLLDRLVALGEEHGELVTNVRGSGLLLAFDLPSGEIRGEVRRACMAEELLVLACGPRSIRLRPALNVTASDVEEGLRRLEKVLGQVVVPA